MSNICPNCQTPITENDKFCPNCGQKVVRVEEPPLTQVEEPKESVVVNNPSNEKPTDNVVPEEKPEDHIAERDGQPTNFMNSVFAALTDFTMKNCTAKSLNIVTIVCCVLAIIDFLLSSYRRYFYGGFLDGISDGLMDIYPLSTPLHMTIFLIVMAFLFMHLNKVLLKKEITGDIYNILVMLFLGGALFNLIEAIWDEVNIVGLFYIAISIVMVIVGIKIRKVEGFTMLSIVVIAWPILIHIDDGDNGEIIRILFIAVSLLLPIIMKRTLTPYFQIMEEQTNHNETNQ